ncbi:MAG: dUTP diphosphatase [Lachnospiraceae bacterium]|nr:dUTP diphosphatase [Lachnospiraceae bacterium]
MNIQIKKLTDTAKVPFRGSDEAAGYDLFADVTEDIEIEPGKTKLIGTGISMAIPHGYFGGVYARSGLSTKEGLRPANCTGVIDSDYRGEIKVPLHNDSDETRIIKPAQKMAQLIISPYLEVEFSETDDLDSTDRGVDGFGSTGI